MAATIRETEAIPVSYPATPSGLSTAALALDADMIWQRIEAYIAWRWTSRSVTWIVEGAGDWLPTLTPATVSTVEVWESNAWTAVTLDPSPIGGYVLPACGPYRFVATVGSGTVPAAVNQAFRRLAEYMAANAGKAGATSESVTAGSVSLSHNRSAEWMARAMQNSGAGDLLRQFRRA